MKIKPSVKKIYDRCEMTRRRGNVMIICDDLRYKQHRGRDPL